MFRAKRPWPECMTISTSNVQVCQFWGVAQRLGSQRRLERVEMWVDEIIPLLPRQLAVGAWGRVRHFEIHSSRLVEAEVAALRDALRPCTPALETLVVVSRSCPCIGTLAEALAEGACPALRTLVIENRRMAAGLEGLGLPVGPEGTGALVDAVRAGKCPRLERVSLAFNAVTGRQAGDLLLACPDLRDEAPVLHHR
jgi:hypothetical protein